MFTEHACENVYANVDRRPATAEKMKSPVGAAETFPCGPFKL